MSMKLGHAEPLPPQEADGHSLTEEEFKRRLKSRTPVQATEGRVELSTIRFSTPDLEAEVKSPLLEARPQSEPKPKPKPKPKPELNHSKEIERSQRLRSSPAVGDLRAMASRSSSHSPARSDDLG